MSERPRFHQLTQFVLIGVILLTTGSGAREQSTTVHPSLILEWGPRGDAPQNLSAALNRLVDLVGASGGALLALVWARVALSWFSNDVTKKVQAKDRARDALIGTLLFTAALTGLAWGLAHWVLTGT